MGVFDEIEQEYRQSQGAAKTGNVFDELEADYKAMQASKDSPVADKALSMMKKNAGMSHRDFMGTIAPYARPVAEYGGLALGGLLGGASGAFGLNPASVAAGAALGGGLGYAGGRNLANTIDEMAGLRQPQTVKNALINTGSDIVEGGMMELGGQMVGPALNMLAKPLSTMSSGIPERLYASAMKMPLSKRMLKQLPREDINARQRAVEVGMRDRISGDAIGLERAKRLKKESYQELIDKVNELDTQGYIMNTDKILRDGLKDAYKIAKGSNTPVTLKEYIDNFAINYKKQKGLIQSPSSVQENKVFNQTQSNYNMPETISGQKQIDEAITKGIARQEMLILESLSPELKRINRNVSAYKDLEGAISRAIGREMNKDVVGLDTKVMAGKWPLALLNATLGHPKVKTSLAFALDKARNTGAGQFIRTPSNRNTGTIWGANYLLKEQPREQEEY
jgi:hypothetical protein